jgi:hypothetical protein
MSRKRAPKSLWDYCLTAYNLYILHGQKQHELVTGNTPAISELVKFKWYEPVYYYDDVAFPQDKHALARWLGTAHQVDQALCCWLLIANSQVIAFTMVQKLTNDEKLSTIIQQELSELNAKITECIEPNSGGGYRP